MPAPLFGHFGVTSTGIGNCQYDANCKCRCGATGDAIPMAYCVAPAEIPEECPLEDVECQLATTYVEEVYLPGFASDPDVGTLLRACAARLEAHCGNVGAGGGGGGVGNECSSGGSDANACTNLESSCSFEDTCNLFECGQLWSRFDADLCERQACSATNDCMDGQQCVPAPLLGHFGTTSSGVGGCDYDSTCECECGATADVIPIAYCLDENEIPAGEECPLGAMDCHEADATIPILEQIYLGGQFAADPDLPGRLEACFVKLEDRADCGSGGAGGSG